MTCTGEPEDEGDDLFKWQRLRPYVLAVVLVLVACVWWANRPVREPVYHGRALSSWLDELYREGDVLLANRDPAYYSNAQAAVRALGGQSMPAILKRMAAHNPSRVES